MNLEFRPLWWLCASALSPAPQFSYTLSSNTRHSQSGLTWRMSSSPRTRSSLCTGHFRELLTAGHRVPGVLVWALRWRRWGLPGPGLGPSLRVSKIMFPLEAHHLKSHVYLCVNILTAFWSVLFSVSVIKTADWNICLYNLFWSNIYNKTKWELLIFQRMVTWYYGLNCFPPKYIDMLIRSLEALTPERYLEYVLIWTSGPCRSDTVMRSHQLVSL